MMLPMGGSHMGHHRSMMMPMTDGVSAAELPDAESAGAKTFARFCSQCHALPGPNKHSVAEWSVVVDRMKNNIISTGKQLPSEQEFGEILSYLQRNALAIYVRVLDPGFRRDDGR